MADRELAAKLAKRLASVGDPSEDNNNEVKSAPPPPVPIIPQKVVENPYVASDNSVSIDDLILQTLERKESKSNNNNLNLINNNIDDKPPPPVPSSPIPPPPAAYTTAAPVSSTPAPASPPPPPPTTLPARAPTACSSATSPKGVPPKTTIRDLLEKELQSSSTNVQAQPKCPVVHVEHHKRPTTPTKKHFAPENDGSELERRLAAQRSRQVSATLCEEKPTAAQPKDDTAPPTVPVKPHMPITIETKEEKAFIAPPTLPDFPPPPLQSPPQVISPKPTASPLKLTEVEQASQTEASTTSMPIVVPSVESLSTSPVYPSTPTSTPITYNNPILSEDSLLNKKDSFEELEEMFAKEEAAARSAAAPTTASIIPPTDIPAPATEGETPIMASVSAPAPISALPTVPESTPSPIQVQESVSAPVQELVPAPPTLPEPLAAPVPSPASAQDDSPNEAPASSSAAATSPVPTFNEEELEERPITPVMSPELLRTKLGNVPSPLLIEMIKTECGSSSRPSTPPPVPPPKPQSRPQSPVVRKPLVSPLGLMCDPLMSVESEQALPSPPIKKISQPKVENPDELNAMLERRAKILEGDSVPQFINRKLSIYAEFSEFSRKQVKFFTDTFKKYDEDCDGFIDFNELKRMMEKLGEAQTHIALKEIIRKVDEDNDGKISLREFFLLFRLAAEGQFGCSEVFTQLAESVDVAKEGVLAAASFFQAKIEEQTKLSKFEEEIKQEQEEKRREEEERKMRREKFLQNKSLFH